MKHLTRAVTALAALALGALATRPASADEGPDDGQKYVSYSFRVDGLDRFPDFVVVAYPWSTSNGAPTREHAVLKSGTSLPVGRRSPSVALYAVRRSAWEAFEKTLPSDEDARSTALTDFVAGPDALRCNAAPTRVTTLPSSDPRDRVEEVFSATSIDAKGCVLGGASAPPAPTASTTASTTAPAVTPTGAPASKPSGCAGGDAALPAAWLVAALALARSALARPART
ncbi:MAG: hypothetical protein U1F43_20300 [Myxococcota bacterium]